MAPRIFFVNIYEQWCDCCKLQKLHMSCSHAITTCKYVHVDYKHLINVVYKLNYVSNVYSGSFGLMKHASYCPKYEGPTMRHDPEMRRKKRVGQDQSVYTLKWTKEKVDNQSMFIM